MHHSKKEPASSEAGFIESSNYLPILGGSRNAIAKNRTPIAKAKIKMYAAASMMVSSDKELYRV
ncbi:hypothetical protein NIES2104_38760 [Leptolyngbya sp. NIES-2104]|nr:hypothetical protein NIES2104_38760 [Leptolyngbya sp. NIES-2104]